ncbi:MAG: response regulator transcription factor, partial [Dehalococcoidia bacterium]
EVARGSRTRDIALALAISEHTVNFHLRNIFAKLRLRTRTQAVAWAMERGLRA